MKYQIYAPSGENINDFIDFLAVEHPDVFRLPTKFDIITGMTSLVSDGEPPKIRAVLEFANDDEETVEIVELISRIAISYRKHGGLNKIVIERFVDEKK